MKVIYSYVSEPPRLGSNERASRRTIRCSSSENCDLYKKGQCALFDGLFGGSCPYGRAEYVKGPTRRAKGMKEWVRTNTEMFQADHKSLNHSTNGIYEVGEYIYLPYSFMNFDNKKVPFLRPGGFMDTGSPFIKKEAFTLDTIKTLVTYRPQAVMGGEIKDYQAKSVPAFIRHLSEKYPDLYKSLIQELPERALTDKQKSNVGRKALLSTLKPNVGNFKDIHDGIWVWDGEYLTSNNPKAHFLITRDISEMRIKPSQDVIVQVSDDGQVIPETVFKD